MESGGTFTAAGALFGHCDRSMKSQHGLVNFLKFTPGSKQTEYKQVSLSSDNITK